MKLPNLSKEKKKKEDAPFHSNSDKPEEILLGKMQRILEKIIDKKISVGQGYYNLLDKMEQSISERERLIEEEKSKKENDRLLSIFQIRTLSDIISSTYSGNGDKVYDEIDRGVMTEKLVELIKNMR